MKEGSKDGEIALICALILLGVAGYVIDRWWGLELRAALLFVYGFELAMLSPFVEPILGLDYAPLIAYAFRGQTHYWSDVFYVGATAHEVWRFPMAASILGLGYFTVRRMPDIKKFMRELNLEDFMVIHAEHWRFIKPFLKINPLKSKDPLWATSMTPIAWIRKYAMNNGSFSEGLARHALVQQLRMPWEAVAEDLEKLPLHVRFLFAAFALKAANNGEWFEDSKTPTARDDTRAQTQLFLFEAAEEIYENGKLGPTTQDWCARIFAKSSIRERLMTVCRNHAYVETALLAAYVHAKQRNGVFASSEFAWLRGVDRVLWYALNGNGGRTFFCECAGIHAHYMGEVANKAPIAHPFVDTAVEAISKVADEQIEAFSKEARSR
jgi:hypothetical protein